MPFYFILVHELLNFNPDVSNVVFSFFYLLYHLESITSVSLFMQFLKKIENW